MSEEFSQHGALGNADMIRRFLLLIGRCCTYRRGGFTWCIPAVRLWLCRSPLLPASAGRTGLTTMGPSAAAARSRSGSIRRWSGTLRRLAGAVTLRPSQRARSRYEEDQETVRGTVFPTIGLTLKVVFGLPLRQTVGLAASLIGMAGLDWPVPDYSTLCRRQARIVEQIPCRRPDGPVTLLVDIEPVKRHRFERTGEGHQVPRREEETWLQCSRVSPTQGVAGAQTWRVAPQAVAQAPYWHGGEERRCPGRRIYVRSTRRQPDAARSAGAAPPGGRDRRGHGRRRL